MTLADVILSQDAELWSSEGDCFIHLYGKGKSRRGPSLRVSSEEIKRADCRSLFSLTGNETVPGTPQSFELSCSSSDSGYSSGEASDGTRELYIPASMDASREETFDWHLTTRNLFAWMSDKPLVGSSLGQAFIDLLERMQLVRPSHIDHVEDCLAYADYMGYLDFAHSPDYALAMLRFADHFHLRELWIDAFVHCVGMNDSLYLSNEFEVSCPTYVLRLPY